MAETYTHGHHDSVLRSHRWRTARNSAAYLLPHLTATDRLLDVGCGPATITVDLATRVGSVVGVDASAEVLREAGATAQRASATNVEFEVADGRQLPHADGQFDVVHAHQVLQHLRDPVGALREMRRVCRPGGVVAARDADYAAMAWYPQLPGLDDWLDLYRRVALGNDAQPDAGRRLLSWARRADFPRVTASASTWCYASDEDRRWWSQLWAERTRHSQLAWQALRNGLATEADLDAMAVAWREWGDAPDGWFVVLNGEIVARNLLVTIRTSRYSYRVRPSNRDRVLDAATRLAQREGVGSVTLDAAAAAAGLSKGGLIYHFPSKEKLLLGMVRHILDAWEQAMLDDLAKPLAQATATEKLVSYVRVTGNETTGYLVDVTTLVATMHDEELARHYRELLERWISADELGPEQTVARLAADGLWLANTTSTSGFDATGRQDVAQRLVDMAHHKGAA